MAAMPTVAPAEPGPGIDSAVARPFGLYPGTAFRITTGKCGDCQTIPQALWYFANETIAVPGPGEKVASYARSTHAYDDLRRWVSAPPPDLLSERPPLVWVAARYVVENATLDAAGKRIGFAGRTVDFGVVPKIPLNRSYFDASSVRFLAGRPLRLRGELDGERFVARTIWPADWRLPRSASTQSIAADPLALRELVRAEPEGGARSPFAAVRLWARDADSATRIAGKPVLALMLNGAQGDDDEAHGGHFAIVTGRVGTEGEMADWLVANFYALDIESEKGIIAAPVPLDNYLGGLNSGQAWYRPSYMLVATLADESPAAYIHGAIGRVYNQFYRHQLAYEHSTMNCTSISVDVLRGLGWEVPARGPMSWPLALVALPGVAVIERSVEKGRAAFDYLTEDQTRLFPAAAFEEIGGEMLRLATRPATPADSPAEKLLRQTVESIWFVRIPQIPSSRAFGTYPIVSAMEYHERVPTNPADRQIVPVPPRPFPEALRDADVRPPNMTRGQIAVVVYGVVLALLLAAVVVWLVRRPR